MEVAASARARNRAVCSRWSTPWSSVMAQTLGHDDHGVVRAGYHRLLTAREPLAALHTASTMIVPTIAPMMVDALRANGVPHAYLAFEGEQHGFRQAANIKRALDAELLFYAVNVFHCGLSF